MTKARDLADLGNKTSLDEINDAYDAGALSNRNLIINGAMQVAQRDTSVTSISGSGYFTVDRWHTSENGTGSELRTTQSQSADAPDGFGSSCKIQVTTPISTITDGYWRLINRLEGLNLQSLNHGSINAKSVTASFWVKSSIASTYSVMMYKPDTARNIGSTYTINSANTWEYKTVTMSGDTVGAIDNNTGEGMYLSFNLFGGTSFVGADNTSWASYSGQRLANGHNANAVVTTNGATFQITGVQLEVGDTATPFEHRSYAEEKNRCARYYVHVGTGHFAGYQNGVSNAVCTIPLVTPLRANPSITASGTRHIWRHNGFNSISSSTVSSSSANFNDNGKHRFSIEVNTDGGGGGTNGYVACVYYSGLYLDAEL
jgi:hypothetical protein